MPIPADLEIEDKVLGPFTVRQGLILGAGAFGLWVAGSALKNIAPLPVLAVTALVVAGALLVAVTARRDGLSLERWVVLALRFMRQPKTLVSEGGDMSSFATLEPTSATFAEPGVLDVGGAGIVAMIECGAINLSLYSGAEARAVLSSLGGVLNALGGCFQVVALAYQIDLGGHAARLELDAATLPVGPLREAALEHAGFVRELAEGRGLYGRRVLLVLREPGPAVRGGPLVAARAAQATALLGACGLTARQLTSAECAAALGPTAPQLTLTGMPSTAMHEMKEVGE